MTFYCDYCKNIRNGKDFQYASELSGELTTKATCEVCGLIIILRRSGYNYKNKENFSKMQRQIVKTSQGFKITKKEESNISISNNAIHIQRTGKPIEKRYNAGYVFLLIDCSGSMCDGNKMSQAKDGARKFLKDSILKGYSAGLIKFDTIASTIMEPQRGQEYIESALSNLYANQYGWTNMADAIKEAEKNLISRAGYKVIVLVTDGQPAVPQGYPEPYGATLEAAESAKRNEIEIITIGTEYADSAFLDRLATRKDLSIIISTVNLSKGIESASNLLMICDK